MSTLNSVGAWAKGLTDNLLGRVQAVFDSLFPPEKRAAFLAKLQAWATANPKLAAFLATNVVLTGLPLIMFLVFTLTVFVFSLVAALLVGLLAALIFTAFAVGVALLIILPTVFMTTMAASFLFLWGLGGYYIVKWFNEGESPAKPGEAIGDKLNSLTGGRLDFVMNPKGNTKGNDPPDESKKKGDGHANGSPVGGTGNPAGQAKGHVDTATKTAGPEKLAKKPGSATGTAGTATTAAKGALG